MKIAYDIKLMRPGCALLQAAFGADVHTCSMFDSNDWLISPTPDLQVYEITEEQLKILIKKTEDARKLM